MITNVVARTDCFFNLSTNERVDLLKSRRNVHLDSIYRFYFGKIMIPPAVLGVILTLLYLTSAFKSIMSKRVSRKCYILLLDRTIGDLVSCLVALTTVGYVLLAEEVNRDYVFLFESFFIGSFWSAMVSYTSLSLLKLFAVWKPLEYRRMVTMRRCIYLIVFSWLMFMVISAITLGVTALVKIPKLNEWSGCKMETCLRSMYKVRNFATVCIYFFTILVFIITVLILKKAQIFSDSFKSRESHSSDGPRPRLGFRKARFPLWKLGLNIMTFAGLNIFYVVWCIGLVLNTDQCYFQRNYAEMMRILGCVRITLVLRICLDPILSFFTDYQLRRSFLQMLGIHHKISFASASGILKREAFTNEESWDGQRPNTINRGASLSNTLSTNVRTDVSQSSSVRSVS